MRILGVDPGSRFTGYGCVDKIDGRLSHVTHGTFKLIPLAKKTLLIPMEDRLFSLYQQISKVIHTLQPQIMVIEKAFFAKNAVSALKLGQVRGALMLIAKMHDLAMAEYSATEVKCALAGYGQTNKEQMAHMIQLLVGKQLFQTWDASDGLALAIYHAQRMNYDRLLKGRASGT